MYFESNKNRWNVFILFEWKRESGGGSNETTMQNEGERMIACFIMQWQRQPNAHSSSEFGGIHRVLQRG